MSPALHLVRLAATTTLAAVNGLAAAQTITVAGPPTYLAQGSLDLYLGQTPSNLPPTFVYRRSTGYNGQNSHSATITLIPPPHPDFPPSDGMAEANDTQLRASAIAAGRLTADASRTPYIHAEATAQITRFWETGHSAVPLDFTNLFDGTLGGQMLYLEVPGLVYSSVRYSLDVVNLQGQLMAQVFDLSARVQWSSALRDFVLTTSSARTSEAQAWADSFTEISDPQSPFWREGLYDVGYLDHLTNAYTARENSVFGLRWTLHTESQINGIGIDGVMTSDFGHTVNLGFAISDGADPDAMLTELLVTPVPEPGTAALALAGALVLLPRLRRARRLSR